MVDTRHGSSHSELSMDLLASSSRPQVWSLSWTRHETNVAAHKLAKGALRIAFVNVLTAVEC